MAAFDVIGPILFWNGAAFTFDGDGEAALDEVDAIEVGHGQLIPIMTPSIAAGLSVVAIAPVKFWDGAAYTVDGNGAIRSDSDPIEDLDVSNLAASITPLSSQPFPGAAGVAPTVTLVSPAEGAMEPTDEVVIDITVPPPSGLRLVVLSLAFNLQQSTEVIYSSSRGFSWRYPGATVVAITNGVRVTMQRRGGWPPGEVRFDPDAVTTAGDINA